MSNITAIAKIDGGWQYTLDTPPSAGWDIWQGGSRLKSKHSSTTYKLYQNTARPPEIDVIDPYLQTASHIAAGCSKIYWQHFGAKFYIIEYSPDGIDYFRLDVIAGNGNIHHSYSFTGIEGATYWKIFAGEQDAQGYYKTSLAIPCIVEQSVLPVSPQVLIQAFEGDAIIKNTKETPIIIPEWYEENKLLEAVTQSTIDNSELPSGIEEDSQLDPEAI